MSCPVCGEQIAATAFLCPHCHSSLLGQPSEPTEPQNLADPVVEQTPLPLTGICPRSWCAQVYPAGTTVCPRCSEPVPPVAGAHEARISTVRLVLPSGACVGVNPGMVLVLGRESPDARIAAGLDAYDGVSRRHAELRVAETGVSLTDLKSTNGTYLDGAQTAGPAVVLEPGHHHLRLGRTAVVSIEVICG